MVSSQCVGPRLDGNGPNIGQIVKMVTVPNIGDIIQEVIIPNIGQIVQVIAVPNTGHVTVREPEDRW